MNSLTWNKRKAKFLLLNKFWGPGACPPHGNCIKPFALCWAQLANVDLKHSWVDLLPGT